MFAIYILMWGYLTFTLYDPVLISGRVTDQSTGLPLHGATVVVLGHQRGAATDSLGMYRLSVEPGRYDVEFRHVGYSLVRVSMVILADTTVHIGLMPSTTQSKSIEVRAARSPRTMTSSASESLSGAELDRSRGQTLGETLAGIVGVDVLQTGASIAKPVIRGFHSDRVITMQAGIGQEGQQWGGEHAPEIDPFSPGRIEVVKGAAGVEYGVGAIGGVIRVIPKEVDYTRRLGGMMHLSGYGNNVQGAMSVNLEGSPIQSTDLSWRVQGSVRRAGDSQTPDYVIDNSGFREYAMNGTVAFRSGKFRNKVYASTYGTELGIYTGAHFGSPNDLQRAIDRGRPAVEQSFSYTILPPKQVVQHHLLSAESNVIWKHLGTVDIHYGLQSNHRREFDAHGRFGRELTEPAFDLTLTTQTLDLRFNHLTYSGFDGKAGLQLKMQNNIRRSTGFLIPDFESQSAGFYVVESVQRKDVRLEAGARVDYMWNRVYSVRSPRVVGRSYRWLQPSGAVGLVWNTTEELTIRMTTGTAWRPPSVNERFSYGVHHGTAQYEIGDATLKPEIAYNGELGVEWESDAGGVRFSVWQSSIRDFIQLLPDGQIVSTIRGAFPQYSYQQYDSRLRGLELSLHVHPSDVIETAVKGAILRGDNVELDEPLYMMSAPNVDWINNLSLPSSSIFRNNTVQLGVRMVARQSRYPDLVQTEAYREPAPPRGYTLLNVGLSTRIGMSRHPVDLSLDIKNVLDTKYRDHLSRFRYLIDEPGRNVLVKLALPF